MNYIITSFLVLLYCFGVADNYSQHTVNGTFPNLSGQKVKLVSYYGFDTYTVDTTTVCEKGKFRLNYSSDDFGMAYLSDQNNNVFIVILAEGENLKIEGETLAFAKTLVIKTGEQNKLFEQYANEHIQREQVLSAWNYLEKIYNLDSLFSAHDVARQAISEEKHRIKEEDKAFLTSLDPNSYISWFLPVRKLVSSVPTIAQYRTQEIPAAIDAFRNLDYTDQRLYKSGLLQDVIESHYWLIENSGRSLDSVFIEMNISIDYMIENLKADEKKFNEISEFLFNFLESRSLYQSSEYLAVKILDEFARKIEDNLAKQLESYRAMKIGNTAPDFEFKGDVFSADYIIENIPQKLSDINSKYIVVVFGASWCAKCASELHEIALLHSKWKSQDVETVFVSLDEDKQLFNNFTADFPFMSICDYQKWDSPIVEAYHIHAVPTMYLLSRELEILLRPNSAKHMDSWVDWFLIKGNR